MATLIIKQGTEDGLIYKEDLTWPPTVPTAVLPGIVLSYGCDFTGHVYTLYRSYLRFNTSSIPAGATITNVRLWLKTRYCYNNDGFQVQLQLYRDNEDWYPLDENDWDCGNILVATKNYNDLPGEDEWFYLDIPIDKINLTGVTAFELKGDYESGIAPTGANYVEFYSGNSSGNEPYLEITYSPPLMIGNYIVAYSKVISFDFSVQLGEEILDSGSPRLQAQGGNAKRFQAEVIAQNEEEMLQLVEYIRAQQLAKEPITVTGLPHNWDGSYYVSVSGKILAGPLTMTLELVEATDV